jgi:hypothetical protein
LTLFVFFAGLWGMPLLFVIEAALGTEESVGPSL